MKREVSSAMIVVGVVAILVLLGGLYYKFLGPGSATHPRDVSHLAPSELFKLPEPGHNGVNTITGEPLSSDTKERQGHPFMGGGGGSMPSPPPGMKSKP
jgi:hypothetical protein